MLADCLTQRGFEMPRVDDPRHVAGRERRLGQVQFSRTMASLAADRMAAEGGRPVAALGSFHMLYLVRMADQAGGRDLPLEAPDPLLITGGESPATFLRIPGDRRLEEIVVALDQERPSMGAGTQHVAHFALNLPDDLPRPIAPGLTMDRAAVALLKRIVEPLVGKERAFG